MPIFNVYQINESQLARVRAHRANSVMGDWNPEGSKPNTHGLSFKEWRKYVRRTLTDKKSPSYLSTSIKHVCEPV